MALFCSGVRRMTGGQNGMVFTSMARLWRHIMDAAVFVLHVVAVNKCRTPLARSLQRCEAFDWELRAVLGGTKQLLHIGVVITDPRA